MDYGLEGKRALVTGAADGCGKAIALLLAQEGAQVILHDLEGKAEALGRNVELCGNGAQYITADLSREDEINALKADVAAATGCDEADIDVEIGEFDDFDNIVDATEDDGKNE